MVCVDPTGRTLFTGAEFDPSRAELVRIVKMIFPTDARMQMLDEAVAAALPQGDQQDVGVRGVHGHVDDAGSVVDVENIRPRFAAVAGLE